MVNGPFAFTTGPLDFGLEQRDPLVQFVHRKRIEILFRQLGGQVVLTARKILVQVHRLANVDPAGGDVNKRRGSYWPRNNAYGFAS